MGRDKAKDDQYFNCSQQSEHDYVAGLYSIDRRPHVKTVLADGCSNKTIHYSTHHEVYKLIERKLGYPVPN